MWIVKLSVAAVIIVVIYIAECMWFPFAACPSCKGNGKHHRKDGKVWRTCRRCKGSGRRIRVGRRAWNYFARKRRESRRG